MKSKTLIVWAAAILLIPAMALAQNTRAPNPTPNLPGYASNFEATDMIEDGSFEGASPNAFWNETSTNFGTPLCDAGSCGTGGGTTGPNTGTWWSWFGGAGATPEVGTVDQDVTLTDGNTVILEYFLWIGADGSTGGDSFEVDMDGGNQKTIMSDDPAFSAGYAMDMIDISAFADGGTHNLLFRGGHGALGGTNFSLDDISLTITAPPPPPPGGVEIPTLSPLGLTLLIGLVAAAALLLMRRRQTS